MIREVLVEPQELAWLPWAVSYFFFIGIAITGVLVAACLRLVSKHHDTRQELIALSIALSCAIVAPIALTADLHQPGRSWHFYHTFAPWSWMAWGALFLPFFTVSVVGYFVFLFRQTAQCKTLPGWLQPLMWGNANNALLSKIFCILSLVSAGLILLYTTMEVYVVAARPLWHQAALSPLLLFSVLPSAAMLTAFFVRVALVKEPAAILRHMALLSTLILFGVVGFVVLGSIDLFAILWQHTSTALWCVVSMVGLLVLLVLGKRSVLVDGLTALMAMLVALFIRWVLLMEVQTLPKYSALQNPYHWSWEVDGGLGMVSMLGLWLLIGVVLWQLLSYVLQQQTGGDYHG